MGGSAEVFAGPTLFKPVPFGVLAVAPGVSIVTPTLLPAPLLSGATPGSGVVLCQLLEFPAGWAFRQLLQVH